MNAIALLLGLLVLSYVGSILAGNRTIRGFGLPSGAEYLLLGFVLGPHVLGVMNRSLLGAFEPMLIVGAAWLALVAGIGYGRVGPRRVRLSHALSGIAFAALIGAGVGGAVYATLGVLGPPLAAVDRALLSGAAGAVCCETTRHAVRWVAERHGAKGPLSDAVADFARASALVPAAGARGAVRGRADAGAARAHLGGARRDHARRRLLARAGRDPAARPRIPSR